VYSCACPLIILETDLLLLENTQFSKLVEVNNPGIFNVIVDDFLRKIKPA